MSGLSNSLLGCRATPNPRVGGGAHRYASEAEYKADNFKAKIALFFFFLFCTALIVLFFTFVPLWSVCLRICGGTH